MKLFALFLLTILLPEPKLTPDSTRVMEYCDRSYSFLLQNKDSAVYYGEKAIELAKEIDYQKGLAQAYNDLGLVYYYSSDYIKTKDLWNASLAIRKNLKDSIGMAAIYVKMGAMNYQTGSLEDCLENQFSAIAIYERVGHLEGLAKSYNNIANVYDAQNRFDEALEYFQKAIVIKRDIKDYYEVGGSLLNVAGVYYKQNKLQLALTTYEESIKLFTENGLESSVYSGAAHNNLSQVYIELDELGKAEYYSRKSLDIRKTVGDEQGIVASQNRLGLIELKKGKFKVAESMLKAAAQAAKASHLTKDEKESHEYLTQLYREKGQFETALIHSDLFHALKDSMLNEQSYKQVTELKTKYETEKKEQQIALQQLELSEQQAENQRNLAIIGGLIVVVLFLLIISLLIRSRSRKKQALLVKEAEVLLREAQIEAALNSQETERKRFARDLHDGFGQMISVLNLNLKSLEKGESDREQVFENSSQVLDDMYKELKGICFNLMPETLIKQGVVLAIREFASRVNQAGGIIVEVDAFGLDDRLGDLQEISIYRITQEWVNNVIKYSDADKITVNLTRDEEELTLLIEDNGSGFDPKLLMEGNGNGWKNMNSRANLIKGELELDTTPGIKGNTLIVNAPIRVLRQEKEIKIPA